MTLKKIVDVIVLVTADSDFIPAMKFARREGAQLMLVTLGNPVSQHMLDHADIALTMPFQETLRYARGTTERFILPASG